MFSSLPYFFIHNYFDLMHLSRGSFGNSLFASMSNGKVCVHSILSKSHLYNNTLQHISFGIFSNDVTIIPSDCSGGNASAEAKSRYILRQYNNYFQTSTNQQLGRHGYYIAIHPTLMCKPLRVVKLRGIGPQPIQHIYNKNQQTLKLWQLWKKEACQSAKNQSCCWGGLSNLLLGPASMNTTPLSNRVLVQNNVPSMKENNLNEQVS